VRLSGMQGEVPTALGVEDGGEHAR